MDKYGRARQATDDSIIWRMYVSSLVTKAADIHSEYVIFLLFHVNNDYSNAPQQYFIRTLSCFVMYVAWPASTHCRVQFV